MSNWKTWHIPITEEEKTLGDALAELQSLPGAAGQEAIPLLVQLLENPAWDLPGFDLFHGRVGIDVHDILHILLGRGLLPMDEAFVIGFTMGSTNKVTTVEEFLYTTIAKSFYPKVYQFDDDDLQVFRDALRLGYISDCTPLSEVEFTDELNAMSLKEARAHIGLEVDLLKAYYAIEQARYPGELPSSRLFG
jgi:hypothetical protein